MSCSSTWAEIHLLPSLPVLYTIIYDICSEGPSLGVAEVHSLLSVYKTYGTRYKVPTIHRLTTASGWLYKNIEHENFAVLTKYQVNEIQES